MISSNQQGQIVTFYSYKGGVGRTFNLANIATCLANWGYKVLCVDWDIEAPGLKQYYSTLAHDLDSATGLVQLISDFRTHKYSGWREYVTRVEVSQKTGRYIDLIFAGQYDNTYSTNVHSINWDLLYSEFDFGNFLEEVRNDWKDSYDFIFVDSRTGITDIGGICTVQLPDTLFLILSANNQSIRGTTQVLKNCLVARDKFPFDRAGLTIVPLVSRLDIREEYKLGIKWLRDISDQFKPHLSNWLSRNVDPFELISILRIPYYSHWSFGEKLPILEEDSRDSDSISYHIRTVAALIAHRFSDTHRLISNRDSYVNSASLRAVQASNQDEFEFDFALSYRATRKNDRFATALRNELEKFGARIFHFGRSIDAGSRWSTLLEESYASSRHLIAIVSESNSLQFEELLSFVEQTLRDSRDRRLIPIYLDYRSFESAPPLLNQVNWIDGTSRDAQLIALNIFQAYGYQTMESGVRVINDEIREQGGFFLRQGDAAFNEGRYDDALSFLNQSAALYSKADDQANFAIVQNKIGETLKLQGRYSESIQAFDRSVKTSKTANRPHITCLALNNWGDILQQQGRLVESERAFHESLEISKSIDDKYISVVTLNSLGGLYQRQGRFKQAVEVLEQCLSVISQLGDMRLLASTLGNLGLVLVRQGHFDEALSLYNQSLSLSENIGDAVLEVNTLKQIADILRQMGNLESADNTYERALRLASDINSPQLMLSLWNNRASLMIETANFEQALRFYERSLDIANRLQDVFSQAAILRAIGFAYIQTSQLKSAQKYLESSVEMYASINNQAGQAQAQVGLLSTYVRMGKSKKANAFLRDSQKSNPEFQRLILSRSRFGMVGQASKKQVGTIIKIVNQDNSPSFYGFIKSENVSDDIFFHSSNLVGRTISQPSAGDIVLFDVQDGERGPQAISIEVLSAKQLADSLTE